LVSKNLICRRRFTASSRQDWIRQVSDSLSMDLDELHGVLWSDAGSGSRCLKPLLQHGKLPNIGSPSFLMALLQLPDRDLPQPLIHRAIHDGLDVTLVLGIEGGQSRQKRL
jgi:hypothetical protein